MSRLSRKYGLYFTLLVAGVVVVVVLAAGLAALEQTRTLRAELLQTLGTARAEHEEETLVRSAAYLGNQLFNPLYSLDISGLNEEIALVRRWLPVIELLVLDREGRVLTDGSAANPRYGERIAPPAALAPRAPVILEQAQATVLWLAVSFAGETPGYARITVSDRGLRESLAALDQEVRGLWSQHLASLLAITIAALGGVLVLGAAFGLRLSHTLTRPLREMSAAARAFAAGDLVHVLPVRSADEVGELARALNTMAATIDRKGRLLAKAQELATLGSWEWSPASRELVCSPEMCRIFGLAPGLPPRPEALLERVHPEDRDRFATLFSLRPGAESYVFEVRLVSPDGEERVAQVHGERVAGDANGTLVVGSLQDVTERRRDQERLAYLASFDALTGLPNRYLFQDRLRHAMLQTERNDSQMALLFLDLDRFKAINDVLGHGIGDELLKVVAARLSHAVRESDTVARLGGDEFTIILERVASDQDVVAVARKVLDSLTTSLQVEGRELFVSGSVGITLYPRDGSDMGTLLKNADTAMYRAKEKGPGTFFFFTPELNRQAEEHLAMEHDLRGALAREELHLHYQPQVRIEDGRLVGLEALLRWNRRGTPESPGRFIPVLEETGLIGPVGEWCVREACRQLRLWRRSGLEDLRMAVNLSARQFQDQRILEVIREALHRHELPGDALEIEITESTLLDVSTASTSAARLQQMGVRLAIDDFGTGYSSLTYLKRFSVDTLKVDRSFVRDIPIDADDAVIAEAIVALGDSLDLEVVAEGVETAEQLLFLRQRRCSLAQGFHVCPPLAADELSAWLDCQQRRHDGAYWRPAGPATTPRAAPARRRRLNAS